MECVCPFLYFVVRSERKAWFKKIPPRGDTSPQEVEHNEALGPTLWPSNFYLIFRISQTSAGYTLWGKSYFSPACALPSYVMEWPNPRHSVVKGSSRVILKKMLICTPCIEVRKGFGDREEFIVKSTTYHWCRVLYMCILKSSAKQNFTAARRQRLVQSSTARTVEVQDWPNLRFSAVLIV